MAHCLTSTDPWRGWMEETPRCPFCGHAAAEGIFTVLSPVFLRNPSTRLHTGDRTCEACGKAIVASEKHDVTEDFEALMEQILAEHAEEPDA